MKIKTTKKISWPANLKKSFRDIIGRQIKNNKLSHAYLLILNNEDVNLAKYFAKILLCCSENKPCRSAQCCRVFDTGIHPDFIYIRRLESEKDIKIEAIRELRRKLALKAQSRRVILIENAHDLNEESANALLKSIEEPGKENIFILTSNDRKKIISTISSRCQIYFLKNRIKKRLSDREKLIIDYLNSDLIKRFALVENIAKDKEETSNFLLQLEHYYRKKLFKENSLKKSQIIDNLKLLARGRDLLKRNISVRLLLENVSIHLSQDKNS